MTRESKLKMLGLEKKAYELRTSGGVTWDEGAKIMNEQHGKELVAKFGGPLSTMAFKRAVVEYEKGLITRSLEEGLDPVEQMEKAFRDAVINNNKKLSKLEKKADQI